MALRRALVLLSLVLACPAFVSAQQRAIPDEAKRGTLRLGQAGLVSVDGHRARLAPGVSIRDQNNLLIVPSALPRGGAVASYIEDASGQIARIWLLTPAEQAKPVKQSQ